MLHRLPVNLVGLPGLAAIAVGFVLFLLALFAARARGAKVADAPIASKASASWIWIAVQGIAIGMAGFERLDVRLDPLSPTALIECGVVLALMLGAVGLFHASSRTMGRNWSLVARTREDHQLVQTGPFAVVRHPIYVALFLSSSRWRSPMAIPPTWSSRRRSIGSPPGCGCGMKNGCSARSSARRTTLMRRG